MKKIQKGQWINLVSALAPILLGLCLILWPGQAVNAICYLVGAIALVIGVVKILAYCLSRASVFDLVAGIFAGLFGLFLIFFSGVILKWIPILVGVYVLIDAILKLAGAIEACRRKLAGRFVMLALAILEGAFGLLLIGNPFTVLDIAIVVIGVVLIINGLENAVSTVVMLFGKSKKESEDRTIEAEFSEVE